jgi:phospholipase C
VGEGWGGGATHGARCPIPTGHHALARESERPRKGGGRRYAVVLASLALTAAAPALTPAGSATSEGATSGFATLSQAPLSAEAKLKLLRSRVKYVFIIFQENRSFDHYFGTYPGANGLFATYTGAPPDDPMAQPASSQPSFRSRYQKTDGSFGTISPFLIPREITGHDGHAIKLYPEDLYSVRHAHDAYIAALHADEATRSVTKNDGYALIQQGLHYAGDASTDAGIVNEAGVAPTIKPQLLGVQKAEVAMSHVDCDTVPLLWQLADRFVLFDNFHQTAIAPSTPNAIAMIAGQVGDTQWVRHPAEADVAKFSLPVLNDLNPYAGSASDPVATGLPEGPDAASFDAARNVLRAKPTKQPNLTFASLPLSFAGRDIHAVTKQDRNPASDLADVGADIETIASKNKTVPWGWYQQGYGPEPFDGTKLTEWGRDIYAHAPPHAGYVTHHNGPQYFGYVGDNPAMTAHMHGLAQFYDDVSHGSLPAQGGVFTIRGGYYNNDSLLPIDPNPVVRAAMPGNDDHPGYSDAQISEASVADTVDAIAASPYWAQSAIIITYDETDGLYDHVPERIRSYGPDHEPETGGPRIPSILISPYAASHVVSHVYSEHSTVIKLIDALFNLVPLADLPDEAQARLAGQAKSFDGPRGTQHDLGPADGRVAMGDMTEAFDDDRLLGRRPPLPAALASIPPSIAHTLPHYGGQGCASLKITPTDYPRGDTPGTETDPPPADFNPRPPESPGNPFANTNSNTEAPSTGPWPK